MTRTEAPTARAPRTKIASPPVEALEIFRGRTSARPASDVGMVVKGWLSDSARVRAGRWDGHGEGPEPKSWIPSGTNRTAQVNARGTAHADSPNGLPVQIRG